MNPSNIIMSHAGAGSGRFSILLAEHGCQVTHFDISQPMIDKAMELAEQAGVIDRITFVKGALEDLGDYRNKSFDMVVSFDAPISYTYPNQEHVIGELVRIAKKTYYNKCNKPFGQFAVSC